MPLTLDEPILGLRAALVSDAIAFLPVEGYCDGLTIDKPLAALRAGLVDDDILFVVGNQQLEADGRLILDKPYIGLLAGLTNDGKQLFVVKGKQCEECYCPDFDDLITITLVTSVGTFSMTGVYYSDFYDAPFPPSDYMITNGHDHHDGWVGTNQFVGTPTACAPIGEPAWGFHFAVWICRCDMRVFVLERSGRTGTIHETEYSICDDPDDVIECDPFHVIRKMDFANPIRTEAGRDPHPLETCDGDAGDCDGAEYVELEPF